MDSRGSIALLIAILSCLAASVSCCCGLPGVCFSLLGLIGGIVAAFLASGVARDVAEGKINEAAAGPYAAARIAGFSATGLGLLAMLAQFLVLFLGVGAGVVQGILEGM